MKLRVNARDINRLVGETVQQIARRFERDLRAFLDANHHRTGLLAGSIHTEAGPDGQAVVGSDVPYAGFFEGKTGAVAKFTADWLQRGAADAAKAGKAAANRSLP